MEELRSNNRLILPFKGLKEGIHEFYFKINNNFFSSLDYSELENGELEIKVKLNKKPKNIILEIDISGFVKVMCDRCLDFFNLPIKFQGNLLVNFNGSDEKKSLKNYEDLIVLSENEYEFDITHYIYESILLSIPYQRIHPLNSTGISTCNKDMLLILKKFSEPAGKKIINESWEKLNNI